MSTIKPGLKATLLLLLSLGSSSVMAGNGHLYAGVEAGKSDLQLGQTRPSISYYDNLLTDDYVINHRTDDITIFGLRTGFEWTNAGYYPSIQLGAGIYPTSSAYQFNGQMFETALGDPSQKFYDYNFKVSITRIVAESQLLWDFKNWMPYVSFGIGEGWIEAYRYRETPAQPNSYSTLQPFHDNTQTSFTYQIGVGVNYGFNFGNNTPDFKHERIGLGYRFVGFGSANLDQRSADYNHSLNLGQLSSNEISVSYTHLF